MSCISAIIFAGHQRLAEKPTVRGMSLLEQLQLSGHQDNPDRRPPPVDRVRQPEAVHAARHLDISEQQRDIGPRFKYCKSLVGIGSFDRKCSRRPPPYRPPACAGTSHLRRRALTFGGRGMIEGHHASVFNGLPRLRALEKPLRPSLAFCLMLAVSPSLARRIDVNWLAASVLWRQRRLHPFRFWLRPAGGTGATHCRRHGDSFQQTRDIATAKMDSIIWIC